MSSVLRCRFPFIVFFLVSLLVPSARARAEKEEQVILQEDVNGYRGTIDVYDDLWFNIFDLEELRTVGGIRRWSSWGYWYHRNQALLKFDLKFLPKHAEVVSGNLIMTLTGGEEGEVSLSCYEIKEDWQEQSACQTFGECAFVDRITIWPHYSKGELHYGFGNSLPGVTKLWSSPSWGERYATVKVSATSGKVTWDITPLIQRAVDGATWPQGWLNIGIRDESHKAIRKAFASSEHTKVEVRPKLVIQYKARKGYPEALIEWEEKRIIDVGTKVVLRANKSKDPGGKKLAYQWQFLSKPWYSHLEDRDIVPLDKSFNGVVSFAPDAVGRYGIQLKVTNSDGYSDTNGISISTFHIKGHPRIWLTEELLTKLRARAKSNDQSWQEFLRWRDPVKSALAYQVTGESKYAKEAVDGTLKNLKVGTGGDWNWWDEVGPCIGRISLVFDWCYDWITRTEEDKLLEEGIPLGEDNGIEGVMKDMMKDMTEGLLSSTKDMIINFINSQADKMVTSQPNHYHNYAISQMRGVGLAGLATYGDNPKAEVYIQAARDRFSILAEILGQVGKGGGLLEGDQHGAGYSMSDAQRIVEYMLAVKTSTGEDLFKMCSYPEETVYYLINQYAPGFGFSGASRCVMEILASALEKEPAGQYARWCVNRWGGSFLWSEPSNPGKAPFDLPLAYIAEGRGTVYMRSGWKEDSTVVKFQCGDHFTCHQRLDQGNFRIYKRGWLITDRGGEWSTCYNTLNVKAPDQTWLVHWEFVGNADIGIHKGYFGQRDYGGLETVASLEAWKLNKELYETGDITTFKDTQHYTYICADLTAAYDNTRYCSPGNVPVLENFTRQCVYLRPDIFIIFDRVTTTKAEFEKEWIYNSERLEVKGKEGERDGELWKYISPDMIISSHDKAKAFCKVFLPEQITLLKELWGKRYSWVEPEPGWKVIIQPKELKKNDHFLILFYITDTGTDTMPPIDMVREDTKIGVKLREKGDIVLFNTTGEAGGYIKMMGRNKDVDVHELK